jgi:hypothetical protein
MTTGEARKGSWSQVAGADHERTECAREGTHFVSARVRGYGTATWAVDFDAFKTGGASSPTLGRSHGASRLPGSTFR